MGELGLACGGGVGGHLFLYGPKAPGAPGTPGPWPLGTLGPICLLPMLFPCGSNKPCYPLWIPIGPPCWYRRRLIGIVKCGSQLLGPQAPSARMMVIK